MTSTRNFRQRTIRIMVGALLSSDLSDDELRDVSLHFSRSDVREIAEAIQRLLANELQAAPLTATQAEDAPSVDRLEHPLLATIYEQVRSKKIGSARLLSYIEQIHPKFQSRLPRENLTVSRLLDHFLRYASHADAQKLFDRIIGPSQQDPYLAGITRKG